MRVYSEFDKEIISKILSQNKYGFLIQDLISMVFPFDSYAKIYEESPKEKYESRQFRMLICLQSYETQNQDVYVKLFNFNDLFDYLLREGLIKVIDECNFEEVLINPDNKCDSPVYVLQDRLRFSLVSKFLSRYQFTEELRSLNKRGYISLELKNNRIGNYISLGAVVVALLAFFNSFDVFNTANMNVDGGPNGNMVDTMLGDSDLLNVSKHHIDSVSFQELRFDSVQIK
jgi:hypothetical protein